MNVTVKLDRSLYPSPSIRYDLLYDVRIGEGYVSQEVYTANSVGFQITETAKLVTHRLNLNFRNNNYPVTHEQWSIMIRLWEEDGLTQNKLATFTGRDQPSVSRLVKNFKKVD